MKKNRINPKQSAPLVGKKKVQTKIHNRFVRVSIFRKSEIGFEFQVLATVLCMRGDVPVKLSNKFNYEIHPSHINKLRVFPKLMDLPIGSSQIRKMRLRSLGYDQCDRAVPFQ